MSNKTFQFGPSNCGKTVLLAVMANQFTAGKLHENGFYLLPKGLADSNELADFYEAMTEGGIFPPGTLPGTFRAFNFKVFYEDNTGKNKEIPQLNFSIFDYAGEDITDGKQEFASKLGEEFDSADQQIVVIDGFALLNYLKIQSNGIDFGALNLGRRRFSRAKVENMVTRCRANNKQVAVIISKCDYVNKFISKDELIRKTKEKLRDVLPCGTVIIPVSSTGAGVIKDEIITKKEVYGDKAIEIHSLVGEVKNPDLMNSENIDVMLSFVFTQFIKREQKKLSDKINVEISKIGLKADANAGIVEREIQKQIDELKKTPNSPLGKMFSNIFEKFKRNTGIGETKEDKIRRLKAELSAELSRIEKEKGALKEKYENDPELKKYAEILDSVNQKYQNFLNNYPEAIVVRA